MRSSRVSLLLVLGVVSVGIGIAQIARQATPKDVVPDKATALAVGRVLLESRFGAKQIRQELPLTARLEKGVWHVAGTLPKGWDGGVGEVWIRSQDCRVVRMVHGK